MIDRVQSMLDALEDDSVAFKSFMKKFGENSQRFFIFFEGEDDINYYNISLNSKLGVFKTNWDYIVSYGRNNVEKIIQTLENHTREEYRLSNFIGFIDKDYHDNPPSSDRIYITPCYSIENFYTNDIFIRDILIHKFKFADEDQPLHLSDYKVCFNQYAILLEQFINIIKDLDILIRTNRLMYENKITDLKINARDLNLDNIIYISLDEVKLRKEQSFFEFINIDESKFESNFLEQAKLFYQNKKSNELSYFIRGKFMLYFIHNFIFRLKEASQNRELKKIYYKNTIKKYQDEGRRFKSVNISVYKESHDILSDFSQYAIRPICLNSFLERIVKSDKKVA
ncbi:DUF4435 domain-containing protein [Acinetobacter nosocomialis]|uniref:DUF4435 domain-containing protein n=1 Tax=Acinetobacter nosocomialis TaxID=106654 RepID=UPI0024496B49|nr:DUF4435 domain-containing protein [Acinetobacter nosocomialis]MDH2591939.1 DUF4435 domain-containing protein [Acinetobacter nosocomialis]